MYVLNLKKKSSITKTTVKSPRMESMDVCSLLSVMDPPVVETAHKKEGWGEV